MRRFVRIAGDIQNLPFTIEQICDFVKSKTRPEAEIETTISAWSPVPVIYLNGDFLPTYFDLSAHPDIRVSVDTDGKLQIWSNFDLTRNYNEPPKCDCGIHKAMGLEYPYHSDWCTLKKIK